MFTKPLTRAPRYILFKSFFLAIGRSYLHDLSQTVLKRLKLLWGEIAWSKALRFLQITAKNQDFLFFYRIFNDKKFIPKYLDNAGTDFALTLRNIEATVFEKKAPVNDFSIFRFLDCFVKNWATCGNIGQIPAPPPSPGKKLPVCLWLHKSESWSAHALYTVLFFHTVFKSWKVCSGLKAPWVIFSFPSDGNSTFSDDVTNNFTFLELEIRFATKSVALIRLTCSPWFSIQSSTWIRNSTLSSNIIVYLLKSLFTRDSKGLYIPDIRLFKE